MHASTYIYIYTYIDVLSSFFFHHPDLFSSLCKCRPRFAQRRETLTFTCTIIIIIMTITTCDNKNFVRVEWFFLVFSIHQIKISIYLRICIYIFFLSCWGSRIGRFVSILKTLEMPSPALARAPAILSRRAAAAAAAAGCAAVRRRRAFPRGSSGAKMAIEVTATPSPDKTPENFRAGNNYQIFHTCICISVCIYTYMFILFLLFILG